MKINSIIAYPDILKWFEDQNKKYKRMDRRQDGRYFIEVLNKSFILIFH